MKKKVLALVLAIAMIATLCIGLVACNGDNGELKAIAKEDIKIGLICLHPASQSTYDKNFVDAMNTAVRELGLDPATQLVIREDVDENNECYDTAVDLVEAGCNIIFADSFGHEDYIIKAAKEFPSVRFCHATGTQAHTEKLDNFYNAFASIYEGRYLAGVVAGLKLNAMIEDGLDASDAKIGYVGAKPFAEVKSGYTSFYLGAKSVCPTVTMDVSFTGSWFDETAEKNTALNLIDNRNCKLISQHADSYGAPTACSEKGVPNVTYNIATKSYDTYLAYSKINWIPYYKYVVNCAINNETIAWDWVGTIANGAVQFGEYGTSVTTEMIAQVDAVKAKIVSGEIKVFDCSKFTVGGKTLSEYMADVNSDAEFTPDTNVIEGGIFKESFFRAAPYFDIDIDGITLI